MAEEKGWKLNLVTPVFRMSFAQNLITPKQYINKKTNKPQGEPKYRLDMVFEPDVMDKFGMLDEETNTFKKISISDACKMALEAKWPGQSAKDVFAGNKNGIKDWPIKKGNDIIAAEQQKKKPYDKSYLANNYLLTGTGSKQYPPTLSIKENGDIIKFDRENPDDAKRIKKLFNSGNYAVAELNLYPQETEMGNFISIYINGVRYVREGKSLGGQSLLDRFDGIDGGEDEFDPTNI